MTNPSPEKSVSPTAPEPFEVGQKLQFVRRGFHKTPEVVTISKVGRLWVTVSGSSAALRFALRDPEMQVGEAGSEHCYGRCYRTVREHTDFVELERAWTRLNRDTSYAGRPADMTLEKIAEIRQLLGLKA
ncbi:MAG: hypothetical protein RLZZ373_3258 [Pseudomonadota bacterium]|jgi:hypothetical protein